MKYKTALYKLLQRKSFLTAVIDSIARKNMTSCSWKVVSLYASRSSFSKSYADGTMNHVAGFWSDLKLSVSVIGECCDHGMTEELRVLGTFFCEMLPGHFIGFLQVQSHFTAAFLAKGLSSLTSSMNALDGETAGCCLMEGNTVGGCNRLLPAMQHKHAKSWRTWSWSCHSSQHVSIASAAIKFILTGFGCLPKRVTWRGFPNHILSLRFSQTHTRSISDSFRQTQHAHHLMTHIHVPGALR